jgi:hypothetical protein
MKVNPEFPISFATSSLINLLITNINGQEISVEDFTVSNDHPNNINDYGPPILNLYPFLINEASDFKNSTRLDKLAPKQDYVLRIHFLLSATGDHTKLFPHILLDSAIKVIKANPIIEFEEFNYTLKITLLPTNTEDSTKIWTTLKCPHKMSIMLFVDTVFKGSTES